MDKQARRFEWYVVGGVLVLVTLVLLAFLLAQVKARVLVGKPLPVLGQIAPFTLTNQNNTAVSLSDLKGHVWVADIIFTRCQGPCPRMTKQMRELQDSIPPTSQAKLISLTTDPEYDTPQILKRYAERFGADSNRWMFLTGSKREIASLAADSLKLTALEKPPEERQTPEDLFIHSTIFAIVDKEARLRGVFETTGEDVDPQKAKAQILAAVRRLERER